MEIIVQGKGNDFFTPNEVVVNINFFVKGETYEEALRKGVNSVQVFVDAILLRYNFSKEDMKTRNFVVREETKYNNTTRIYEKDGFSYSQRAVLKFDYDKERMANFLSSVSELDNPPICQVNFGVKDDKECRRAILAKAYADAEMQAQAIADAAGKTLVRCQKVDYKSFTDSYMSPSVYDNDMSFARRSIGSIESSAQMITNTFTPEDIELSETLYCLWIAE